MKFSSAAALVAGLALVNANNAPNAHARNAQSEHEILTKRTPEEVARSHEWAEMRRQVSSGRRGYAGDQSGGELLDLPGGVLGSGSGSRGGSGPARGGGGVGSSSGRGGYSNSATKDKSSCTDEMTSSVTSTSSFAQRGGGVLSSSTSSSRGGYYKTSTAAAASSTLQAMQGR